MMTLKWRRFSSVGAAVIPGTGAAQTHGQQRPCVRGQTPRVCAARAQLAPSLPRGGFMRGPQGANVAGRGGIEARGGGSTAARAAAVATHRDLSAGSPSPVSHPPPVARNAQHARTQSQRSELGRRARFEGAFRVCGTRVAIPGQVAGRGKGWWQEGARVALPAAAFTLTIRRGSISDAGRGLDSSDAALHALERCGRCALAIILPLT